jgi:hypothetical protein
MSVQGSKVTCSNCGRLLALLERGHVIHRSGDVACIDPKAIACRCTTVTVIADLTLSGAAAA